MRLPCPRLRSFRVFSDADSLTGGPAWLPDGLRFRPRCDIKMHELLIICMPKQFRKQLLHVIAPENYGFCLTRNKSFVMVLKG